jgi:AraC family transcriptional regulator
MAERFVPLPARQGHAVAAAATPSFRVTETFYPGGLVVGRHAHANPSFTITLRGGLRETYAGRSLENASPFILLARPPGEPHTDRIHDRGVANLEIELRPHGAPAWEGGLGAFDGVRQLQHPRLTALVRSIGGELRIRDTAQSLVVEGLVLEVIGLAARLRPGASERRPPRWLVRVRERLESSFRERLPIIDLAREAGVHPVSLARAFRSHYGSSPGDYVRRLRIEWSAGQLRARIPLSLADIALEAGFSDQSHFIRAFRRQFGTTPGVARRRAHEAGRGGPS